MCERRIGEVDEDSLAVTQGRDPHQRADGLDVSTGFADEAPYVGVRQLDLDRDSAASTLERLHRDLVRLFSEGSRHVLHERPVVDSWARRTIVTLTPEPAATAAAVEPAAAAAAKITPWWSLASLRFAQESPPASTDSARLRSAERPAGAKASPCPRRSSPGPDPSSDRSTPGAR